MSTFAKSGFKSLNYNSFRPQYPPAFYQTLVEYTGKSHVQNTIDLGCGTGAATFPLLNFSQNVKGLDLSPEMIKTASELKADRLSQMGISDESRIDFFVSAVEDFQAPADKFDLMTAAECIHWFKDYDHFFRTAHKQLKPGATLAYWYYVDPLVVGISGPCTQELTKSEIVSKFMRLYDTLVYKDSSFLGPHWEQPGRSILRDFLKEVDAKIPSDLFEEVKIRKYDPTENPNPTEPDHLQLAKENVSLAEYTKYLTTFSAYHNFQESTGKGQQFVDKFIAYCESELGFDKDKTLLDLRWSSGYTFMKKRS